MANNAAHGGLALIGFGEAARAFVAGWPVERPSIRAFDIKTDDDATRSGMLELFHHSGIDGRTNLAEALSGATMVFSLVTADQAFAAARDAASHIAPGTIFIDGNSCGPDAKRTAAAAIEAAGASYVDMAIMAPVRPAGHRVPVLLAGSRAETAKASLDALGMKPAVVGRQVGQASTVKMLRSVMIKGLEALFAECLLSARLAGMEGELLACLAASNPEFDWHARAAYNLDRMMVHGLRRASEMDEAASTVASLGVAADMSRASADWQRRIGALGLQGGENCLDHRLDRILAALGPAAMPPAR